MAFKQVKVTKPAMEFEFRISLFPPISGECRAKTGDGCLLPKQDHWLHRAELWQPSLCFRIESLGPGSADLQAVIQSNRGSLSGFIEAYEDCQQLARCFSRLMRSEEAFWWDPQLLKYSNLKTFCFGCVAFKFKPIQCKAFQLIMLTTQNMSSSSTSVFV